MLRTLAVLALLALLLLPGLASAAQEAGRAATPEMGECPITALPPGTPSPLVASPAAAEADEAAAMATPEPTPAPAGAPADQEAIDRVVAAEYAVVYCLNADEYLSAATLFSPAYRASPRGVGNTNLYDFAFHLERDVSDSMQILQIENVELLPDGRYRDEITYYYGDLLLRERDYWVEQDGVLMLDWVETLAVNGTPTP